MHKKSRNAVLARLDVGDVTYVESTLTEYLYVMRAASSTTRWPDEMKGREFVCRFYTAVGMQKAGDIRYLVRIERTK